MTDTYIAQLVRKTARELLARGWKLGLAESCTGGWIAHCCTDLAGSSAWFERGFVTYSDEAKAQMLGVDPAAIREHGAVSRDVAEQMAAGVRNKAPVDASIAVTGIAGPDGGTAEKPVGTVWFAWTAGDEGVSSECRRFDGDREAVRRQTVIHALEGLLSSLRR